MAEYNINGFVRQTIDPRDYSLEHEKVKPYLVQKESYPAKFSLQEKDSPIEDQGNYGSCTSFAGSGILQFYDKQNGVTDSNLSQFFIYFWNRYLDNGGDPTKYNPDYAPNEDTGATIRSTMDTLLKFGDCTEILWPYTSENLNKKPSDEALKAASSNEALTYFTISEDSSKINNMKKVLYSGLPIMFGSDVAESIFDVGTDGIEPYDTDYAGGHARVIVGWNDSIKISGTSTKGAFLVRNSWGTSWGANGYSWVSYKVFKVQQTDCMGIITASIPEPTPTPTPEPVDNDITEYQEAIANIKTICNSLDK